MSAIEPDTKDWTWVLERPCPACGYDAGTLDRTTLGARLRRDAAGWPALLAAPDAAVRPAPGVWSVLEYGCHVRDVHGVFGERVALMLAQDDPVFGSWDQDEAALDGRYQLQHPATVARELMTAADTVAAAYDAVPGDAWGRRGRRSDGSVFTVETLGRYHLHDVVHHAHDVRAAAAAVDDVLGPLRERFAAMVGAGGRVLEIGSGAGRDAAALEALGLAVRRTDVAPGLVELLCADGHDADVLDPLVDDLDDPRRPGTPYDGVRASASLLHVARADLPVVLARLAAATRPGGALHLSVKQGDGEGWSTHGSVPAPRRFTSWRADALAAVVAGAGWEVAAQEEREGQRGETWHQVLARRR
ncbi:methyltransferase domain-containing protein [Nocardioides dongkuii]|uniref:methyltransferase domain-containing protein n=1 Tax=Nocardioides dongkuii TaxID=2760089 RepID=UPI0015FAA401|nr:methyltransferase domain-containing protein [Nocardioides dongkuii]